MLQTFAVASLATAKPGHEHFRLASYILSIPRRLLHGKSASCLANVGSIMLWIETAFIVRLVLNCPTYAYT